jgi:hypothetical protein
VRVKKRLEPVFFKAKEAMFRPDSPSQETVAKEVARKGVKTITTTEIYNASPYQAFNKGRAVGTLRVVPVGTPYESFAFEPTDIALLQ